MIVWLWSAGQSAGVTDELGKARAAAGGCMAIGGTAVVEPAYYVDGTSAVTTGYAPSGGTRYAGGGCPAAGSGGGGCRPRKTRAWRHDPRVRRRAAKGVVSVDVRGPVIGPVGPDITIDTSKASPARMYDYYLGGKDNFQVDREAAHRALLVFPEGRDLARENRGFLARAVEFVAGQGVRQFIDVGAGLPASPSVHEVVQKVHDQSRIVFVDNDPQVLAHNRAWHITGPGEQVIAVRGDARHPAGIAADPLVRDVIDFSRPVGLLLVAVLHFVRDEEDPWAAVAQFRDLLAPGSYLVLSHLTSDDSDEAMVNGITQAYAGAAAPAVFRTARQIGDFFDGFNLVDPGVVHVSQWRPPHPARFPACGASAASARSHEERSAR